MPFLVQFRQSIEDKMTNDIFCSHIQLVTFPRPIVGGGWVGSTWQAGRLVSAGLPTSQDVPIVICPELRPMIGIQHFVSYFCSATVM